ncbi:serine/threonine-protein kinase SBK1 isoform X2 [Hermetia illucens]|uniref:serine/threonine-protein kinase SBK1 isoform X2 n=1 Tax=Hermetia illucens TaxID=343691 RepID=UPI0018CC7620|nr:serine/threonine-protein kinase SBK1 isoform X2 [Hermetia illucens]
MTTNRKPPGVIHKIREFELEKIHLADEFDILQIVGEGWFGKILLVEHRATDTEMVLKALPKPYVSLRDFYREFHYGLHLGVHKNIVTTYDVAFETAGFYVFTQEYAPLGDLTSNVTDSGIGELHSKRVAKQIASALDYMHSKGIVHRDVKLDNVLIYKSDFSRIKLCDFGESYRVGTIVERRNEWLPYSPPEVLRIQPEGNYKADTSHDVWQFGILIFVCLTGCLPWQKAGPDDPRYVSYIAWHSTNIVLPFRRTPKLFKLLSSKGSRLFRKFLEPREERRPKNLSELASFMDDRWLSKGAEKNLAENEQDELCASMYSFHSSPEEKNKLLATLAEYGIETTVDRVAKKNRIKDWIESSVITEEDEDEDSNSTASSPTITREPVPGHISSIRAQEAKKQINTTLKDASQKHFDPRTGEVQTGPSEMGAVTVASRTTQTVVNPASKVPNGKNGSFDNGSVVTLASRNDLILSEGQSYQSNLNLTLLDEDIDIDTAAEPMVIASRHQQKIKEQQLNHQNNLAAFSNMFLYDDYLPRSNPNSNPANPALFYRNYDHINKSSRERSSTSSNRTDQRC